MRLLDLVRVDVQKRQKMKQILFSLLAYFILARGRVLLDTMDEGLMNYEEDDSFAQLQVGISLFSKYVYVSSLKSTRTLCKCARHSISATRNSHIRNWKPNLSGIREICNRAKRNRSMSAILFSAVKIPLSITIDTPSYSGPPRGDEYLLIKTTFFLAWGTSVTSSLIQLPCYYDRGQPKVMFFQFDQLNSWCEQIKQSI